MQNQQKLIKTYKSLYKTYKNIYKTYKKIYKTYKNIYKLYKHIKNYSLAMIRLTFLRVFHACGMQPHIFRKQTL